LKNAKVQQIIDALEATEEVTSGDIRVVDVELTGSGHLQTVRVYLDKPGGLTLDDIAAANSWVGACIEELDPIKSSYTLEVSSPGIDRPLRTLQDFTDYAGEEVQVKTDPVQGRSNWTGTLKGTKDGNTVLVEVDGKEVALDLIHIQKARIKGKVDFNRASARKD
jgi:ribosome maturation factor RimP